MTVFEKIGTGEIPARIIFEAEDFFAFEDNAPQAPVHVLIVPRRPIPRLGETTAGDADLLGRMLQSTPAIAAKCGVAESGYRVVINNGPDAGESVPHLHLHLLGKRQLAWPPG